MNFSSVKGVTIPNGIVTKIVAAGKTLWELVVATYKNQVPISTDTDGSIFNGTGYKENVRLSSSGGISGSAQNGSVTTGFMPFPGDTTIIRMKGVTWPEENGKHYYVNFYDSSKKFKTYIAAANSYDGTYGHIYTVTTDSNGVITIDFNESYGTSNSVLQLIRQSSYIRITAKGSGANMIVTVNEEIN